MIKLDTKDFTKQMIKLEGKLLAGTKAYGLVASKKMEAYAKTNAQWKDRTGNARQTIKGFSEVSGTKVIVGVSGNMEYSPKLELGYEKKYAILYPTIQKYQGEILKGFAQILK